MDNKQGRYVDDAKAEQVQVVRPQHLNGRGRLFGGQLAVWIDEIAVVVARRHCGCEITTAAIDNLIFREPVYQNETVVLRGKVSWVGRTSLEVRVDSFVDNMSGHFRLINTAFVIQVPIDADGRPVPVPPLLFRSELEKAEFAAGDRRSKLRKSMRKELYN